MEGRSFHFLVLSPVSRESSLTCNVKDAQCMYYAYNCNFCLKDTPISQHQESVLAQGPPVPGGPAQGGDGSSSGAHQGVPCLYDLFLPGERHLRQGEILVQDSG